MKFKNIESVNQSIKDQLKHIKELLLRVLGQEVVGIYLHGSMAFESFVESKSDLDILMITSGKITRSNRLKLAKGLMDLSTPCPVELSGIAIDDLQSKTYPIICQFHYSDYWTTSYKQVMEGTLASNYILDHDFEDADIVSYMEVINQKGICLYGKSIEDVFPKVSSDAFWHSISAEIDDFEFDALHSRYFVSNILILGRIYSFKKLNRVLSKYEASLWLKDSLPEKYLYIVNNSIDVWFKNGVQIDFNKEDLEGLKNYLINKIKE